MKLEDFGIEPKTGIHDRNLTRAENLFVGILWVDHVGDENAIAADDLAIRFHASLNDWEELTDQDLERRKYLMTVTGTNRRILDRWKRDVRLMQNHLLEDHDRIPVISRAGVGGGYWIAASDDELDMFHNSFKSRAITGFRKAHRGNKLKMAKSFRQIAFDFEMIGKDELMPVRPGAGVSMPVEVVDQFLERMLAQPEKFAGDIQRLSEKYGGVLMAKHRHQAARRMVRDLARILD
jgi:hypothetical protein